MYVCMYVVYDDIKCKRQQAKLIYYKTDRPLKGLQIGKPIRLQPVNPTNLRREGSCAAEHRTEDGPRSYLNGDP